MAGNKQMALADQEKKALGHQAIEYSFHHL
jgi:hypothetical protein